MESWNPVDWVTDATGAVIGGAANGFLGALATGLQDALSWAAKEVGAGLTGLSEPDFASASWVQVAGVFKWLAIVTVVGTILAAAGGAAVSGRHSVLDVAREIPITVLMLSAWYGAAAVWFEGTRALTEVFMGDALQQALASGLPLDAAMPPLLRGFAALLLLVGLVAFAIEMLVLSHVIVFAVALGPVSLALRPWPGLRDVSSRMVRNVAAVSLTPALAAASMSIAVGNIAAGGVLGWGEVVKGLAGLLVSVLVPFVVAKFLPLGGSADSGARALIAAGAAAAATAAGAVGAIAGTASAATSVTPVAGSRLSSMNERS